MLRVACEVDLAKPRRLSFGGGRSHTSTTFTRLLSRSVGLLMPALREVFSIIPGESKYDTEAS